MLRPEGIFVAMLTPFSDDGSINEKELRKIIDFQIDSGVHGLFPISSVGEFIHMTREEKIRMMEIVVDQNRGRVRVTPGIGSSHPGESIYLGQTAKEIGCDGVVVAPPYFYPHSQKHIETYFETISDALDLPLVLYNIPLFTQPLSYDVVKRLAHRENVVAMKDSSGSMVDFIHFFDIIRLTGDRLNILTGREETLFPSLMVGGKGCMTATAGILPEVMLEIYETWKAKAYEKARKGQFSILALVRAMFSLPFPLGFKAAMEMRGYYMGPSRFPLADAEQVTYRQIKAEIQKIMKPILESLNKTSKGCRSEP